MRTSLRLLARRPSQFNGTKDPLDMVNLVGPQAQPFDFPLTRPTLLKQAKQRQILHYLRLESLQFKDLVAFRKPFTPPNRSVELIQVRHQHYQGELHPASRKISISVPVSKLFESEQGLRGNEKALHKFKLLAGPRFQPTISSTSTSHSTSVSSPSSTTISPLRTRSTTSRPLPDRIGTFKLSCESFPSDRMNEKWCSDTLSSLVKESLNLNGNGGKDGKDSFEDVPVDLRGMRKKVDKKRLRKRSVGLKDFPKEWLRNEVSS